MRELQFDFYSPQIKINGIVFDLQKSDIEICEIAKNAQERFERLDRVNEVEILEACKQTAKDIDAILGEGALKKLSGGNPVSIVQQINVLVAIAKEGTAEYMDYVKNEYLPEGENEQILAVL